MNDSCVLMIFLLPLPSVRLRARRLLPVGSSEWSSTVSARDLEEDRIFGGKKKQQRRWTTGIEKVDFSPSWARFFPFCLLCTLPRRSANMSKRTASASSSKRPAEGDEASSAPSTSAAQRTRTGVEADDSLSRASAADDGMGEFEDQFEDEMESEDDDDDDEEQGGMEVDGVKVDGEIERTEGDQDEEQEQEEEEEQVYLPGDKLEEGQTLEPDQSAYEMLHRLNVTWPCLSFDHLRDNLGSNRQRYPHTAYLVAGTQADVAKNNEVMVMKASGMHKTQRDDGECRSVLCQSSSRPLLCASSQ